MISFGVMILVIIMVAILLNEHNGQRVGDRIGIMLMRTYRFITWFDHAGDITIMMLIQTYRIIIMVVGLNLLYIIILWGTLRKIFPALPCIINI